MEKVRRTVYLWLTLLVLVASYVYAAAANPTGAQGVSTGQVETLNYSEWGPSTVYAEAGNVTEINMTGVSQTASWQGYYGEITGTITLDDAQNNTMYDWYAAEPQGEIYASNSSAVTWENIVCLNYTGALEDGYGGPNLTSLEAAFKMNYTGKDGFDETFNETGNLDGATPHDAFYVGIRLIASGTCPATDTYESDSAAGTNFQEVLLTDNTSLIFATIIENDVFGNDTDPVGFDGASHDFQMLVAEDGHNDDRIATPYYFYVELE